MNKTIHKDTLKKLLEMNKDENKNNFNKYVTNLLNTYSPEDRTIEGMNLLSVYLLSRCNNERLEEFLDKKYTLDCVHVPANIFNDIIKEKITNKEWHFFEKNFPLKNNIGYTVMCIPCNYRYELIQHFYQPEQEYCNGSINIIDDLFSMVSMNLTYKTFSEKEQKKVYNALLFLAKKNKITFSSLESLLSKDVAAKFLSENMMYFSSRSVAEVISNSVKNNLFGMTPRSLSNLQNYTGNTIDDLARQVLIGWKVKLEKCILEIKLSKNTGKKTVTNKI